MNQLDTRIRMAAESILENEALRDGLYDEQAASALLNWGITWAEYLALQTAHIADDVEAEDEIYPRMKALRKMLVAVKDLAIAENWPQDSLQHGLQTAFNQAQVLNGESWQAPEKIDDETWLILQTGDSLTRINNLRALISGTNDSEVSTAVQQNEKPDDTPATETLRIEQRDEIPDNTPRPEVPSAEQQQEQPENTPKEKDKQKTDGFFTRLFKPK